MLNIYVQNTHKIRAENRATLQPELYIQGVLGVRSILRDLIPELILSQKLDIHMGPIRNGSGVMSF